MGRVYRGWGIEYRGIPLYTPVGGLHPTLESEKKKISIFSKSDYFKMQNKNPISFQSNVKLRHLKGPNPKVSEPETMLYLLLIKFFPENSSICILSRFG